MSKEEAVVSATQVEPPVGLVLGNGPSLDLLSREEWERLYGLHHVGVNRAFLSEAVVKNFTFRRLLLLDHPRDVEHWGQTPNYFQAYARFKGVRILADRTAGRRRPQSLPPDTYFKPMKHWVSKDMLPELRRNSEEYMFFKGGRSPASAANLLALENCRTILFIGVDGLPGRCKLVENYEGVSLKRQPETLDEKKSDEFFWEDTVAEAKAAGVSLLSIAPKSNLKALPRVPLGSLKW